MKKGLTISLVVIIILSILGLALVGCTKEQAPTTTAPATTKPAEQIILKWADADPISASRPTFAMIPTLDQLEKDSNGRIKVERYWGGTLVSADNTGAAIGSGLIDFGVPRQYTGGPFGLVALGGLPYAGKDCNNITKAINELVAKGYMKDDLTKVGLYYFTSVGSSGYHALLKDKKPMTFDQLKGIKIRNPGGYLGPALQAMGMVPVTLTPAEVYDAVSKGVVEAVAWHLAGFVDFKIHEVTKNLLMLDVGRFTTKFVAFNAKKWDTLPADVKALVAAALDDEYMALELESYEIGGNRSLETMKAKGMDIYNLPEAEMAKVVIAVTPVWDNAIADLDKKGLPGKQIITDFVDSLKAKGENPPWKP
ncbi:MAG: TRAP transporter substrate-binding protein DctP [Dehalococcoidales bacterium]|nr:TRAP transporter substrate-binding protein DctP [Dehalococcoidales bacterium]